MRTIRLFQYNVASDLDEKINARDFKFLSPWLFASRLPAIEKVINKAEADIFMLQGLGSFKYGDNTRLATDELTLPLKGKGCEVIAYKPNDFGQELVIAIKKGQFLHDKQPYNLPNIKGNEVMILELVDISTKVPFLLYNVRFHAKENRASDLQKISEHIKLNMSLHENLKIILAGDLGGELEADEVALLSMLELAKYSEENSNRLLMSYIPYPFEFSAVSLHRVRNSAEWDSLNVDDVSDTDKLDLLKELFLKEKALENLEQHDFLYHMGFEVDEKSVTTEILGGDNVEDVNQLAEVIMSGEHDPMTPSPHLGQIITLDFDGG